MQQVSDASFTVWLRRLRTNLNMTQEEFAEHVGCSVETIRAFEYGRRRPSTAMAEHLAQVLEVEPALRKQFVRLARQEPGRGPNAVTTPDQSTKVDDHQATRPTLQLPVPQTALIGRQWERAELHKQILESHLRLITLLGPGGVGKTRLALQIANDLAPSFAHGVAFVALAPLTTAENVVVAIAESIGCPLMAPASPEDALLAFVRDREMLLVLDNLEHVLDASPLIGRLVREASRLHVVVTSRERLRVQAEHVFDVGGLAITGGADPSQIDHSDAVMLFLTRARHLNGDFMLKQDNRHAVMQICTLLDGMPLGIELAAAWVRALTPDEIVVELQRGLDFLALADRDSDPRHHSMRAVIDASWSHLNTDERRILARLSVFRGGCTREAATIVTGATLPVLVALIDKSLLHRSAQGRFELHELVRQYAADQLATQPDGLATTGERHCSYYAAWTNTHRRLLQSPQQREATRLYITEIDNLRTALRWAVEHRAIEPLWLIFDSSSLFWFYELRSWYQEAEMMAAETLAALGTSFGSRREELLYGTLIGQQGWFQFRQGHPEHSLVLLHQSLDILKVGDHPTFLFFTLIQIAYIEFLSGNDDEALALQDQIATLAQRIDRPWIIAHMHFSRSMAYTDHAPETAYANFRAGLPAIRAGGDRYILSLSLIHMGEAALVLGKTNEAEDCFAEALDASLEVENGVTEVLAISGLATAACVKGAWDEAVARSHTAVARARNVGEASGQAKALLVLAEAEHGAGKLEAARRGYQTAIAFGVAAGALPAAIDAWLGLATLDMHASSSVPAIMILLALVRRHPATRHQALQRADALLSELAQQDADGLLGSVPATVTPPVEALPELLNTYAAGNIATILRLRSPQD